MWLFAICKENVMTLFNKARKNFQAGPKKYSIWPWPISDASEKNVRDAKVHISGINLLIIQNKPNVAATVSEWMLTMHCKNTKHEWSQLLLPWVIYGVWAGQHSFQLTPNFLLLLLTQTYHLPQYSSRDCTPLSLIKLQGCLSLCGHGMASCLQLKLSHIFS